MDYQNIFGYAATGLSVCFYCALTLPFLNVLRCKSSYEFTPISIIDTIYIDTLVWYIFAEKIECEQLKLSNMIGCCCSLLLIAIYLGFELKKYAIDSILNCLILILGTLVTHKGLTMVVEDPQIIGKFAIAAKLITFSTPIFLIYRVVKEKNYKIISLNITLTYMASSIGWLLFGKAANELNIMIANGIGVAFCFIQFIVYLNFKKKFPNYSDSSSTIGIEKTSTEDSKKDESTTIAIDEEKQDKAKEKPVKIVTRVIEN